MLYAPLGSSGIRVSKICLGTMTWGEQNTQSQAFSQMDYALDVGVNFWDTAELYSVPPKAETYGRTEQIIGQWLQSRGRRDDLVLASKIAGPSSFTTHIREGRTQFTEPHLRSALEASLKRLKTDYLDLYQLHWPERQTNFFGELGFQAPSSPEDSSSLEETLCVLSKLVQEGKIRTIGLSNETPWGVMKCLHAVETLGLEKIVTVQNPYSLLNRSYEVGLAEISYRENVGLLAYSPLGFGVLSGKYLNEQQPKDARLTLFPHYDRYSNPNARNATELYAALARGNGLTPAQLALAFVHSRPFLTSTIIGATTLDQLKENIDSVDLMLEPQVLEEIERIHRQYPIPAP